MNLVMAAVSFRFDDVCGPGYCIAGDGVWCKIESAMQREKSKQIIDKGNTSSLKDGNETAFNTA